MDQKLALYSIKKLIPEHRSGISFFIASVILVKYIT